jgi:small-conductance mechanosensitive channel
MRAPNESQPRYYFAFPRLAARVTGGSARRSEQNWYEAILAGTLVHSVVFISAVSLVLGGRAVWEQMLLLLPLALLVLASWSVIMYINALVIKAIRTAGFLNQSADRHLQSALVGIITTICACYLVTAGSWMRLPGLVWIVAVVLNLAAAAILALMHAEPAR